MRRHMFSMISIIIDNGQWRLRVILISDLKQDFRRRLDF